MKVELVPVELKLPKSVTPRSEGVHLSGIIRCIATEMGILKPEWAEELSLSDAREITDPVAILRISIGLAWESWFIPQLPNVVDHPGEMVIDNVYMTPDGESVDVIVTFGKSLTTLVVHEVKATYKSINTVAPRLVHPESEIDDLETQWMWITQCKGYCKGLGTRFARLYVLFLCGDYVRPITPQLLSWRIEFTQEEIDKNWELITDYRDQRIIIEAAGGFA